MRDMIFVTGPLFAGKEEYIKAALKLTDEELDLAIEILDQAIP